jgi:methionine-rich copper-binding protein CopC
MRHLLGVLGLAFAMAVSAAPALAHSTVKSTAPVSGSILPASPAEVTITFNEPARMTSIVVAEAGKPERKLEFMPGGSATVFMVHNPNLATGRNEIKWTALSKDGHPISGSIIIVIKPGAAPSSPKPAPSHDHHGR